MNNRKAGEPVLKSNGKLALGGIRNKLFLLILVTVILFTAVFLAVMTYQNNMLADLSADTGRKQLSSITEITGTVMGETIRENMIRTTELEAKVTNEIFRDAQTWVTMLSRYAARLFTKPGAFRPQPWQTPDVARDGELTAQVIFAEGTDPSDPEVQAAVGLVSNLTDMMLSSCSSFNSDNAYIGLSNGAFLTVNNTSASWFEEDGSLRNYDPRTRFWYKQAADAGKLIFTDVETDANTGELSLVCAMPVYGPDGTLCGVVGTDLFLNSIQTAMQASEQSSNKHVIVNQDGHIIASSLNDSELRATISGRAADLRESGNEELAAFIRDAMDGQTDVRLIQLESGMYFMAAKPVETVGWSLISVYGEENIARPAVMLQENFEEIQGKAGESYREKNGKTKTTIIVAISVLVVLLCAAALLMGKKLVHPLQAMTKRISGLDEDNLEFKMEDDYRTGDEIEILADSFARLSHKTMEYVEQVRTATAEKEHIVAELRTAAAIQSAMLPQNFPDRQEFCLFASMDPAREVGGDFYDFFLIDDDHLGLVMADVSGKGIPAALFMMVSKVILQSCAMLGRSAGEILEKTNEAICSNNKAEMFVTVWIGILEISTGKLTAANAGHEYPALKRVAGDYELYKDRHGFVIGGLDGVKYSQYELQLNPGDKLFLYTDGVPEATNADKELFGTDRMVDALNKVKDAGPQGVLNGVRKAVDEFVKDAEQFDDMTMLCFEYKGPQTSASGLIPSSAK